MSSFQVVVIVRYREYSPSKDEHHPTLTEYIVYFTQLIICFLKAGNVIPVLFISGFRFDFHPTNIPVVPVSFNCVNDNKPADTLADTAARLPLEPNCCKAVAIQLATFVVS